jgi:hypothetical protein
MIYCENARTEALYGLLSAVGCFHGPIMTQSATCVRALVRIVGNTEVGSRVASLNFSTDGLPVIRPESRFCCWALPTKISLLSAIPRSLQPCDLSSERRRAARRWPCSEPRRAYEPARLYQRSTRNARKEQQPLLSRQCFREDQPNRVVVPHLFCLLKLSYDS